MGLPSEALLDVFAFFGPINLVATSLASKRFNALIRDSAGALAILRKVPTVLSHHVLADVLWFLEGTLRHMAWPTAKLFDEAIDWGRCEHDGYNDLDDATLERLLDEIMEVDRNI